uniref:Carbohydrate kinase PfkB domain-containing protein n=1 Tax=Gouania willdenowi TaxID=441366 RepID=A0A8C5DJ85_GOUWI
MSKEKEFFIGFGGKGANQCVQAARLGVKTAMICKVGKDYFGDSHIRNFKDNGVHTGKVCFYRPKWTNPIAQKVEAGENAIVIVGGANMLLGPEELHRAVPVISRAKVLVCQLEISPNTSLEALRMAKQHKAKTIFNPAPAMTDLDPEFYRLSDVFCCNESEVMNVTHVNIYGIVTQPGCVPIFLLYPGCCSGVFIDKITDHNNSMGAQTI